MRCSDARRQRRPTARRKQGENDRSQADRDKQRQDELLDEALEETFPASDPIAPARIRQDIKH